MSPIFYRFLGSLLGVLIFSSGFCSMVNEELASSMDPKKFLLHGRGHEMSEEELSPLRQQDDFIQISLSNLVFRDLSFLGKMKNLEILALNNTNLKDEDTVYLKGLSHLTTLDVHETEITTIEFVTSLPNLQNLNIKCCKVDDITPLKQLKNLRVINLAATQVNSLEALQGLLTLEELNISNTLVTDIAPLQHSTALKHLWIINTPISSLRPLNSWPDLKIVTAKDLPDLSCALL